MSRNIKKIIAKTLLLTLLIPNISVNAMESNVTTNNESLNEVVDDHGDNLEVSDVESDSIDDETIESDFLEENTTDDIIIEATDEVIDNENLTKEDELYIDGVDEIENIDAIALLDGKTLTQEDNIINSEYEVEVLPVASNYRRSVQSAINLASDYSTYINERYEFDLKAQEMQYYSKLRSKTSANYEIAMAHEDGSYTYLGNAETMEEAISKVETTPVSYSEENSQPVIINSDGRVVYSTYSIARIYKHVNGSPYPYFDRNSNLYSDAGLTKTFTYINQGYVDDAPIIEFNGSTSAKILVSGYQGWINMNTQAKEYDILVYPVNQVKNPSHYYVENGILYHFITSNLTSGNSGYSIEIGKAPSYLSSGARYFSYDGKYFYDGSNIASGLTSLIQDVQTGSVSKAINASNPYYSYYQNLPFRSRTSYSAAELNSYIANYTQSNSKLRDAGQALKDAESQYGVNALLALGIAINESGWGVSSIALNKNNIFGLNAVDSNPGLAADTFPSVAACISDFTKNWISRGYADPADWRYYGGFLGNKNLGANVKYASDPYWGEKAAKYAFLCDLYLSGNVNSLEDTNLYQLAIFTSPNQVINSSGYLLYNVNNHFNNYSAYVGTPFIMTNSNKITVAGKTCYEIYPERNTAVNDGGEKNKYHGNYNWNDRGYISASGIELINESTNKIPTVSYTSHVQSYGWQSWKQDGQTSGTSGESKRLEGIKIEINNYPGASIRYSTHVQSYGWQDWKYDGLVSGTSGESKRLEAIKIEVMGLPENYEIMYRVHIQGIGWQDWKYNGEIAGTTGQSKRLEAIEIKVVEKAPVVRYQTHVQSYGWQNQVSNGDVSGTSGEAKRLEAINIDTRNLPEGAYIRYRTHVQSYGWQEWKTNGQVSGTEGQAKRLEAIQIELVGAPGYHIEYRAHVQSYGWESSWKRDGQVSGTEGQSKRLEAIQIRIVRD
ncbi:glucosaminidase domain-containing protein [Clostridium disporicum]|uniref:Cell wall binding repeat-containing protein /mannosyl-glycoprotein endo-beta-N-acetylglucosamidase domain-containing protein n=1 Tax=Clostridium disporicum TaxID=84024 RepID=A0A174F2V1_9CLOT|nr:glucosaminidase domain-containing protein [Clostridium disporicum]CUO43099.1 cell wall binding repeat-containing protein /mannosyl-glycoprotein endo-beta-N-acetylglucosamidase domain-containing protein [Clostridium disporicum]